MTRLLQSKNLASKFLILIEIAANQPNIQQRDIARKMNVTAQAISEYIKDLVKDGWVVSDGRSKYRVTKEGVNWILSSLNELKNFSGLVEKAITNLTVCAAIADSNLAKNQTVGLVMKEGKLIATPEIKEKARGIAVSNVKKGEDVGISNIEGIVEITRVKIMILRIPDIRGGGSRGVYLTGLKKELGDSKPIAAIGLEALTALNRIGVKPDFYYGAKNAVIEAGYCGLSCKIVCIDSKVSDLIQNLEKEGLAYEIIDLKKNP